MKCWICENEAKTGEHKTKASDLRSLYGKNISQKKPLFLHTDERKNQKAGSIKSNKFKFNVLICSNCNNSLTAPYDKAWEQLSGFLRKNNLAMNTGATISLDKAFLEDVPKSMLYAHLYFIKLFGCALAEHKVPINICSFAENLRKQTPNSKVFLAFGPSSSLNRKTGLTNIEAYNDITDRCVYAEFFYVVGTIAVNVIYVELSEKRERFTHAWNPILDNKIIWNNFEPIEKHNKSLHSSFTTA